MDSINCEICGGEMEYRRDETTQGWYCTNCGWNVVTSYIEPIYEDVTTYNVFSSRNIQVGVEQLKAISKIKNINFIEAKHVLETEGNLIYKGKAVEIKEVRDKLEKNMVEYYMKPEFPY